MSFKYNYKKFCRRHYTYIFCAEKHFHCASLCDFPRSRCNWQGQPPLQHQILGRAAPPFLLDAPAKSWIKHKEEEENIKDSFAPFKKNMSHFLNFAGNQEPLALLHCRTFLLWLSGFFRGAKGGNRWCPALSASQGRECNSLPKIYGSAKIK